MKVDEFTKPIEDMTKEELERYIISLSQSVKEDFREAAEEYKNEQSRKRNKITAL